MDGRKTVSIQRLIIVAVVLLAVFVVAIYLSRVCVPAGSAVRPPAGKIAPPAGADERSYSIPPDITINPFPSDEDIKKDIEDHAKRREILKAKIENRDKKAAIVRAEVIAVQSGLLSDEVTYARRVITTSPKTIPTVTYVKKGLSNETKNKILSGGYHVGH